MLRGMPWMCHGGVLFLWIARSSRWIAHCLIHAMQQLWLKTNITWPCRVWDGALAFLSFLWASPSGREFVVTSALGKSGRCLPVNSLCRYKLMDSKFDWNTFMTYSRPPSLVIAGIFPSWHCVDRPVCFRTAYGWNSLLHRVNPRVNSMEEGVSIELSFVIPLESY